MRILLVDDEAQVLRGMTRMIESEADSWEVNTASSGAEAIEMLNSNDFNIIVSDMRMPGMDGAELLELVEERFPKILRVVLSGQADRNTVMRAIRPMHQYLSKPCDPRVLIDTIRRAEIYQTTIPSTDVLNAVGRANCLPSPPTIVAEINRAIDSNSGTAATLAKVVAQDPVLCAKILQLVNSAVFGCKQPVSDIERGLSVLGMEMTRALALSLSVFTSGQDSTADITRALFEHSVDVACIGRRIAVWESADVETVNSVFSGGLLHDIGKVVLLNAFGQRYARLIPKSMEESKPVFEVELDEFGASHAGIGSYLLEMWGLPSSLIAGVGTHHSLDICSRSSLVCRIVYGADWIANGEDDNVLALDGPSGADSFVAQLRVWKQRYVQEMKVKADG